MNYEEMKGLEEYVARAVTASDQRRAAQAEAERIAAERRERERLEKLAVIEAGLREIVPPELWPLVHIGANVEGWARVSLIYDDFEIMRLGFDILAETTLRANYVGVPDAVLFDGHDEDDRPRRYAIMVWRSDRLCIETTEGGRYSLDRLADSADSWQLATAKAFEVLAALRDYERRAAEHNANLDAQSARRLAEREQREAEQETSAPENYVLLEYDDLFAFSTSVNRHLKQGYALHGPSQVVMYDDPEYPGRLIPVYYQAVVLPEAF